MQLTAKNASFSVFSPNLCQSSMICEKSNAVTPNFFWLFAFRDDHRSILGSLKKICRKFRILYAIISQNQCFLMYFPYNSIQNSSKKMKILNFEKSNPVTPNFFLLSTIRVDHRRILWSMKKFYEKLTEIFDHAQRHVRLQEYRNTLIA